MRTKVCKPVRRQENKQTNKQKAFFQMNADRRSQMQTATCKHAQAIISPANAIHVSPSSYLASNESLKLDTLVPCPYAPPSQLVPTLFPEDGRGPAAHLCPVKSTSAALPACIKQMRNESTEDPPSRRGSGQYNKLNSQINIKVLLQFTPAGATTFLSILGRRPIKWLNSSLE